MGALILKVMGKIKKLDKFLVKKLIKCIVLSLLEIFWTVLIKPKADLKNESKKVKH